MRFRRRSSFRSRRSYGRRPVRYRSRVRRVRRRGTAGRITRRIGFRM